MLEEDIQVDDEESPLVDDALIDEEVQVDNESQSEKQEVDDDQEQYGKRVSKRIDKLVYERNIEREENAKLKQRLEELEGRFNESHQSQQQDDIASRLAEMKRRKLNLMEEADYEEVLKIDEEILDLKLQQREAASRSNQQQSVQQPGKAQIPEAPEPAPLPEAQQGWLNANDWYIKNMKSAKAKYANDTYLELIDEGYDASDPELYQELDNRIGNKRNKREQAPPTSGVDRGSVSGRKRGDVTLTADDIRQLEDLGLNPNDERVRARKLAEKKAMMQRHKEL